VTFKRAFWAQWSGQAPFNSEIKVRLIRHSVYMNWKESVSVLPKVAGFLRVLRIFPQGMLTKVGWERIQTNPFHRSYMLHGQKLVIRCHPCRGALGKPIRLVWIRTVSFVIQLSFQLKVRMIRTPPLTYWLTINTEKSTISNINIYL
jgi:hypothetical protein